MRFILVAGLLSLAPLSTLANQAADTCAAKLAADGLLIYQHALPGATPAADLRALVEAKTRELAMAGRISRTSARSNAVAVHECLMKLRS